MFSWVSHLYQESIRIKFTMFCSLGSGQCGVTEGGNVISKQGTPWFANIRLQTRHWTFYPCPRFISPLACLWLVKRNNEKFANMLFAGTKNNSIEFRMILQTVSDLGWGGEQNLYLYVTCTKIRKLEDGWNILKQNGKVYWSFLDIAQKVSWSNLWSCKLYFLFPCILAQDYCWRQGRGICLKNKETFRSNSLNIL